MFKFSLRRRPDPTGLLTSRLYDQGTFYEALLHDMRHCRKELIVECPFISVKRMKMLLPVFQDLRRRNVRVIVNTRPPGEHDVDFQLQAEEAIDDLMSIGVKVLFTGGHHRKIVILDQTTLWEGSLNVLSFNDSCEVMRRISSTALAQQMIDFLNVRPYLVP